MDEETLEAAACAILFLGEAALRTSAANLVRRAHSVADAAAAEGAANADHQGDSEARKHAVSVLLEAAKELEDAESAGRTVAVSGLLGAATTLQAALGVGLDELGAAAGDLARQCAELRESTAALERVIRAAEKEEQNRSAPWLLWRWRRWGRSRTSTGDLEDGLLSRSTTQATATGIMEATRTAVDFLSNEPGRMTGNLLELADKIGLSAHRLAVPDQRLKVARDALQRTNSPSSQMDAVNGLEAVAMEVQEEARDQRIILQRPAVQLAAACQSYLKASDAMVTVQRAATERARERETAPVTVQNVQPPQPGADPGPGQGDQRRSSWMAHALGGSLTLAPYLISTNGNPAGDLHLEEHERWKINLALSLWLSVVATGAVFSSYAQSWIEFCYAQFAGRVGMYGINIFAIYFLDWALGIKEKDVRRDCFWFATILHFLLFVAACWRRDP